MGYIGHDVRPQRVWIFSRLGHILGIDFSHFAAILVINRVSIFALYSLIRFFRRSYFFITPPFSHPRFAFLFPILRLLRRLDKASKKALPLMI